MPMLDACVCVCSLYVYGVILVLDVRCGVRPCVLEAVRRCAQCCSMPPPRVPRKRPKVISIWSSHQSRVLFFPTRCHHTPTLFLSRPVGLSIRETRISFCYGKFLIKLAAYGVVVVPPLRNDDIVDGETVMPASDTPTITPPEPVFNLTIHRASYHVEAATGPGHYSNYMSLSAAAFSRMWSGLSGLRSWPLSLSM